MAPDCYRQILLSAYKPRQFLPKTLERGRDFPIRSNKPLTQKVLGVWGDLPNPPTKNASFIRKKLTNAAFCGILKANEGERGGEIRYVRRDDQLIIAESRALPICGAVLMGLAVAMLVFSAVAIPKEVVFCQGC